MSNFPKRAFRTRLPPKVKREAPSEYIYQPCQAVSRFQPLQTTPAHTPIPMSQRHSPPPQFATSRFPAPATKCDLRHTSQPHDSPHLPRESHFHTSKPAQSTYCAQPHPTSPKHHPPNANPTVTIKKTADLTKRCACAANSSSTLHPLTVPHVSFLIISYYFTRI